MVSSYLKGKIKTASLSGTCLQIWSIHSLFPSFPPPSLPSTSMLSSSLQLFFSSCRIAKCILIVITHMHVCIFNANTYKSQSEIPLVIPSPPLHSPPRGSPRISLCILPVSPMCCVSLCICIYSCSYISVYIYTRISVMSVCSFKIQFTFAFVKRFSFNKNSVVLSNSCLLVLYLTLHGR